MSTTSTRPKRKAAAKAVNIIELSDSEEDESYEPTPEKRQRTIKVVTKAPKVSKDTVKTAKQGKETKPRKPRSNKKSKETTTIQIVDENTPPNAVQEENGEIEEILGNPENVADGQCLEPETYNTNDLLNNSSMCDEQHRPARLQGRNSFWGNSIKKRRLK